MALKMDILESDRWFTNSDYQINCHIRQADETTPQDVTGWQFSWLMKKRASDLDASAVLAKTLAGNGIVVVNAAQGHVRVLISADDTDGTFRAGTYHHELKRTGTGVETPVVTGLAVLRQSAHVS
jgi:hypothetical protein